MSKNQDIGKEGEEIAVTFLLEKGYEIAERNWRFSKAEVDIICKKDDQLIFIEVKTRSYTYFGEPAEFVTTKKEELMMDAANVYMTKTKYEWKIRFDIISVILDKNGVHKIEHIEDAFFPGW
jgi:putative endonuclease